MYKNIAIQKSIKSSMSISTCVSCLCKITICYGSFPSSILPSPPISNQTTRLVSNIRRTVLKLH